MNIAARNNKEAHPPPSPPARSHSQAQSFLECKQVLSFNLFPQNTCIHYQLSMAESVEPKAALEAEKKKEQSIPFYQLFSFADKYDWLLMAGGSLGAFVHGSAMPVFFLLFGEMVNGFGKNQSDLKKLTEEVSKVCSSHVFKAYPVFQNLNCLHCLILCSHSSFFLQYALYFVYLGLVVCVSSYAGLDYYHLLHLLLFKVVLNFTTLASV